MMKTWCKAKWPVPANIHAGTSLRSGGQSMAPYNSFNLASHVNDQASAVRANRNLLKQTVPLPAEPRWLTQVHGTVMVNDDSYYKDVMADGSVTDQKHTVLVVLTADCLPLLLYDQITERLAAVHIGWRGFAKGMVPEALQWFAEPKQCLAWLGPAIQQQHYEIDISVRTACLDQFPQGENAFLPGRENHWYLDLPLLVSLQLQQHGVHNVYDSGQCSYSNSKDYFSYRRDGETGRMATLIWRD